MKFIMESTMEQPEVIILKSQLPRPSVCSSNQSFTNSSMARLSVPDDIPSVPCRLFAFCVYICCCFGWPCHLCEMKLRGKTEDGNNGEGQVYHVVCLVDFEKLQTLMNFCRTVFQVEFP